MLSCRLSLRLRAREGACAFFATLQYRLCPWIRDGAGGCGGGGAGGGGNGLDGIILYLDGYRGGLY